MKGYIFGILLLSLFCVSSAQSSDLISLTLSYWQQVQPILLNLFQAFWAALGPHQSLLTSLIESLIQLFQYLMQNVTTTTTITPMCYQGETKQYDEDNTLYWQCMDGEWILEHCYNGEVYYYTGCTCLGQAVYDPGYACVTEPTTTPLPCVYGETKPSGTNNTYWFCSGNGWYEKTCPNDSIYIGGSCVNLSGCDEETIALGQCTTTSTTTEICAYGTNTTYESNSNTYLFCSEVGWVVQVCPNEMFYDGLNCRRYTLCEEMIALGYPCTSSTTETTTPCPNDTIYVDGQCVAVTTNETTTETTTVFCVSSTPPTSLGCDKDKPGYMKYRQCTNGTYTTIYSEPNPECEPSTETTTITTPLTVTCQPGEIIIIECGKGYYLYIKCTRDGFNWVLYRIEKSCPSTTTTSTTTTTTEDITTTETPVYTIIIDPTIIEITTSTIADTTTTETPEDSTIKDTSTIENTPSTIEDITTKTPDDTTIGDTTTVEDTTSTVGDTTTTKTPEDATDGDTTPIEDTTSTVKDTTTTKTPEDATDGDMTPIEDTTSTVKDTTTIKTPEDTTIGDTTTVEDTTSTVRDTTTTKTPEDATDGDTTPIEDTTSTVQDTTTTKTPEDATDGVTTTVEDTTSTVGDTTSDNPTVTESTTESTTETTKSTGSTTISTTTKTSTTTRTPCNVNGKRRSDPLKNTRYYECIKQYWVLQNCPPPKTYNPRLAACT